MYIKHYLHTMQSYTQIDTQTKRFTLFIQYLRAKGKAYNNLVRDFIAQL